MPSAATGEIANTAAPEVPRGILQYIDYLIASMENGSLLYAGRRYEKGTIKMWKVFRNVYAGFMAAYEIGKGRVVTWDSFDKAAFDAFVAFCRDKGYMISSINKMIICLKTAITYAHDYHALHSNTDVLRFFSLLKASEDDAQTKAVRTDSLEFSVTENTTGDTRYGSVTIKDDDDNYYGFTVIQTYTQWVSMGTGTLEDEFVGYVADFTEPKTYSVEVEGLYDGGMTFLNQYRIVDPWRNSHPNKGTFTKCSDSQTRYMTLNAVDADHVILSSNGSGIKVNGAEVTFQSDTTGKLEAGVITFPLGRVWVDYHTGIETGAQFRFALPGTTMPLPVYTVMVNMTDYIDMDWDNVNSVYKKTIELTNSFNVTAITHGHNILVRYGGDVTVGTPATLSFGQFTMSLGAGNYDFVFDPATKELTVTNHA